MSNRHTKVTTDFSWVMFLHFLFMIPNNNKHILILFCFVLASKILKLSHLVIQVLLTSNSILKKVQH